MKILYKKSKNLIVAVILIAIFSGFPYNVLAQDSIEIIDILIKNIDGKTVEITWTTNIETQGKIIYGKSSESLGSFIIDNEGIIKHHKVLLGNLEPETSYYFQIISSNNDQRIYSFIQKFKTTKYYDKIAPIISNLSIPYVSGTAAVITWQTDEEGTSVVEYDENQTYTKKASNYSITTNHQITLRGLNINTRYYFRIYSIDKDNNKSNFFHKDFITLISDKSDKENLIISYLKPNSVDDKDISNTSVTVSFKTNHYAKGKVYLGNNLKYLGYNLNHQIKFSGLAPDTEYALSIYMDDIFNKKAEVKNYLIKTAKTPPPVKIIDSKNGNGDNFLAIPCSSDILSLSGYYGQYFNLPTSYNQNITGIGRATGWYDDKYLSFYRTDSNLNFGNNFFPLNEGMAGDPYYFSVYWRAILEVPADGNYSYNIKSDDDSWVYIDNNLTTNLGGIHKARGASKTITLSKGLHNLEIYFAERKENHSFFSFELIDNEIKVHPWPADCSLSDLGLVNLDDENVHVKGVEFFYYTPATALYKTADSPDVYAIINNQRHYISSPASFREYGYNWADVKTVSWPELSKYPRARLIKTPDSSTIYYLYQRPENQWLKIAIPSPTVFISYTDNYWGNVIKVTQLDIDSYPDAKIIKTFNDSAVYYLENNAKHFISESVFQSRNFKAPEIVEVSHTHLETYKTGLALE